MTPAKTTTLEPPKSLGKVGRAFWKNVCATYDLSDAHHHRLLENAATSLDRAAEARASIATVGLLVKNRFGELVANPACNIERQANNAFRQNVRELGLDVDSGPVEVRGPRRPGSRS